MRAWLPFIVYFGLELLIFFKSGIWHRHPSWGARVTIITFLIYLTAVLWLCLTPAQVSVPSAHKVLFHFHGVPFNAIPFQGFSVEFFLNIIMTFPLGVYIFLFNRWTPFEHATLYGLLFSLFIECNQFLWDYFLNLQRLADIDDLITNTLGAVIGFSLMIILYQNGWRKFLQRFMLTHP
ncbi:MAG TPA: VanZ family protein [Candidatus Limosilactobacillus intestinigallinarum]|nr:VanZ family protein [Candidatus Limosilactobacillus intestinigallinarum]